MNLLENQKSETFSTTEIYKSEIPACQHQGRCLDPYSSAHTIKVPPEPAGLMQPSERNPHHQAPPRTSQSHVAVREKPQKNHKLFAFRVVHLIKADVRTGRVCHVLNSCSSRQKPRRHASDKQPSRWLPSQGGSHRQGLLPVDVQDLQGIRVHSPAPRISKLHCLWLHLQKPHIAPHPH